MKEITIMNNEYVVRAADGSIDINGSVAAFATALGTLAESEVASEDIRDAVDAVCDKHPDNRLPMQALISLATTILAPEPSALGSVTKRVHAWIRATAKETGRFEIVKGVGGGVKRLALEGEPVPAKTAKTGS